MKKMLCFVTALFALSWASAQTGSYGQGQSGGSSDQSSMGSQQGMEKGEKQGMEKGEKKGAEKGMKKKGETTLAGCLSGPNAEGNYELQHGAKKVEVSGGDDLKEHVGHTVKLHGSYVKAAAMEGKESMEKGGAKEEKGERHFKVSSIDHVSETCKGGAMGKGEMGEHKMDHKMDHHDMGDMPKGGTDQPNPSKPPLF